jgi:hypothetical protein
MKTPLVPQRGPSRVVKFPVLLTLLALGQFVRIYAATGAVTVVPDIATLRTIAIPSANDAVLVQDYYSPASLMRRGGGLFRWVSGLSITNEDGGYHVTNINSASGVFERILNGETLNVKMFGAKGDGVTNPNGNDTAAIQRAMDSARKAANHILIPMGYYNVTNTVVFQDCMHIEGEGPQHGTVVRMIPGTNNVAFLDIFRTRSADVARRGGLYIDSNGYWASSNYTAYVADMAHGLIFENIWTQFGSDFNQFFSASQKGAGLCLFEGGEAAIIRNVQMWGGGYGIRCIGGGTPGLRVENSTFFYQAIAGVCVEAIIDGAGTVHSDTGPMTFTGVSGDMMSTNQEAIASLILITNVWPNATITDISAEGVYGGGVVRLVSPPNLGGVTFGTVKNFVGVYP